MRKDEDDKGSGWVRMRKIKDERYIQKIRMIKDEDDKA